MFRFGDQIGLYRLVNRITGGSQRYYDAFEPSPFFRSRKREKVFYEDEEPEFYEIYDSPKKEKPKSYFSYEGEEITQDVVDRILDKIAERGYQSLTEKEKRILLELSKRL